MMDIKFSKNMEEILTASRQEALSHNSDRIHPEHILLALLKDVNSSAFKAVERTANGTSAYNLQQELDRRLFEAALDKSTAAGSIAPEDITATDLTNRIVKLSALEARMLKSPVVDTVHLLLATFHSSETQASDYMVPFHRAGVTYESLYSLLSHSGEPTVMNSAYDEDDDEDDDMPPASSGSQSQSSRQSGSATSQRRGSTDTPVLDKFGYDMTVAAEENLSLIHI